MSAVSREREGLGVGLGASRSPDTARDAASAHRYAVHLLAEACAPGPRSRARSLGAMAAEHLEISCRLLARRSESS